MTPQDIGLPHSSWRPGQWEFVVGIADSPAPHSLLIAPTGFGKSLTYMGIAHLTGWRVVILTATRSLEDQLTREFEETGLVDVRGRSNYPCRAATDPSAGLFHFFRRGKDYTAAHGPCRVRMHCPLKDGGCAYFDKVREAVKAQVTVTNYDFWLRNKWRFADIDLLVMDEAHQAPDELVDYLSFTLTPDTRAMFKGRLPDSMEVPVWAEWAEWATERLKTVIDADSSPEPKLMQLYQDLGRMAGQLVHGEWVVERTDKGDWKFDCINPEEMGKEALWGTAKRVLLVSATVNLMTAKALGMDLAKVKVWEGKSSFPVERRPVYAINGAPRLNFRSMEGEKRMWVALIDRVLDARKDRKGIIHTTSFERAKYLSTHSRHKTSMILNESRDTSSTITGFRRGATGFLVSPSVTTGWDFPFADCQFQIIGKIPFPDLRSKAAKARAARNKEWAGYTAAQVIVQASGRGMRSEYDQCETFIVDGNFDWWFGQNRKYVPRWWQAALTWVELSKLPLPPPSL